MEPQNHEEARETWGTLHSDMHEERKLEELDRQLRFRGLWDRSYKGCPHQIGKQDSVSVCEADEMRPCIYELSNDGGCKLFKEILEEWREEEVKVGKD